MPAVFKSKRQPAPHHKDIENKLSFDLPIIQLSISFSVMIKFVNPSPIFRCSVKLKNPPKVRKFKDFYKRIS